MRPSQSDAVAQGLHDLHGSAANPKKGLGGCHLAAKRADAGTHCVAGVPVNMYVGCCPCRQLLVERRRPPGSASPSRASAEVPPLP